MRQSQDLKFARSIIHDWVPAAVAWALVLLSHAFSFVGFQGLFATAPIEANQMVIEYIGEYIRQVQTDFDISCEELL